jgi:hypothetical protein
MNVVCVTYRCKDFNKLKRDITSLFPKGFVLNQCVIVDTDDDIEINSELIQSSSVNSFFEFSGFNYGLELLSSLEGNHVGDVLFINDTIFEHHYVNAYRSELAWYIKEVRGRHSGLYIYGKPQNKFHGVIIPTCFFVLNIDGSDVNYFIDENLITKLKGLSIKRGCFNVDSLFISDELVYNERLNGWLKPKSFLKGWYKASPYTELSKETFERKSLTIYLEHRLCHRIREFGGVVLESRNVKNDFLFFIDRLYQLRIKFFARIRARLRT